MFAVCVYIKPFVVSSCVLVSCDCHVTLLPRSHNSQEQIEELTTMLEAEREKSG